LDNPWTYDDPEFVALRRQAARDKRINDELDALELDAFERELNEVLSGWHDYRGRPLPGFEPVEVRGTGEESWMAERRRIELAAIRARGSR
jgi:hypothetical protein